MLRLCEKNGRQLRNHVGPAQLLDLALKRTQTLVLGEGHPIAGPSVDLCSLNPVKQRLGGDFLVLIVAPSSQMTRSSPIPRQSISNSSS